MIRTILPLVVALAAPLSAQIAHVSYLGTGCTTPDGTPTMGNLAPPTVGQPFNLFFDATVTPNHVYDGSTQTIVHPHLVIGFTPFAPFEIPPVLFPTQPPLCELQTTHDIVVPMEEDRGNGRNQFKNSVTIPISNDPVLLGAVFFAQWMVVHTQCGIAGCNPPPSYVAMSELAICQIGT